LSAPRPRIFACATALAIAAAIAVAGCGGSSHHQAAKKAEMSVATANNNGAYVYVDNVTYQLQISRELNPYSPEDSQYVKGLPAGITAPGATQMWYGVFIWAKNQTEHPQTTADRFEIVDTQGNVYYPVELNPLQNPYAWVSRTLPPLQTEPAPNTPASEGPTQGSMLLFKVNNSVYANRPLTFYIFGSNGKRQASISLDL
jgi:hypothetical protein